jgi:drug/metabolite transporter (DMT)-like permease
VYAISLLPLSLLTIVQNTQAFWTAFLAFYLNKEQFHAIEGVGIIACFIGVLLIAMSGNKHEEKL